MEKGGRKQCGKQRWRIIWGKAYRRVTLAWRKTELAVKLVDDPSPLDRNTSVCCSGCRIRSGVTMRSAALGGDGREAWGPRPDQNVGPSGPGAEKSPLGMWDSLERETWREKLAGSGLAFEHYRILQR